MLDEVIYLFFDNEISVQGEFADCFAQIDFTGEFQRDIENLYTTFDFNPDRADYRYLELKPLGERKLFKCLRNTKYVREIISTHSLFDLESGLADSAEMRDCFREVFSNGGLLFGVEVFDAGLFWTGASLERWFNVQFPLQPKKSKYNKPPSVLDLLYEFLESLPDSQENYAAFKKALLFLTTDDRLFLEDMLNGKLPNKDSKETERISARILHALKSRSV